MAQRGPPRYPKSYGGKDLVGAVRPDGWPRCGIRPPPPANTSFQASLRTEASGLLQGHHQYSLEPAFAGIKLLTSRL